MTSVVLQQLLSIKAQVEALDASVTTALMLMEKPNGEAEEEEPKVAQTPDDLINNTFGRHKTRQET